MGERGRIYTTFRKLSKYYTCPATILVSFILSFDLWEHLQTRLKMHYLLNQSWISNLQPKVSQHILSDRRFGKVFLRFNCFVALVHMISSWWFSKQRRPEPFLGCTQFWTDIFSSFTFFMKVFFCFDCFLSWSILSCLNYCYLHLKTMPTDLYCP